MQKARHADLINFSDWSHEQKIRQTPDWTTAVKEE